LEEGLDLRFERRNWRKELLGGRKEGLLGRERFISFPKELGLNLVGRKVWRKVNP